MLTLIIIFTLLVAAFMLPSQIGQQSKQLNKVQASLNERMSQLKQDFQFRTKELARRLKSGDLAQEEWQELSDELEKDMLSSIEATQAATNTGISSRSVFLGGLLIVFGAAIAVISYFTSNNIELLDMHKQVVNAVKTDPTYITTLSKKADESRDRESLEKLYLALRTKADIEPNNVNNWRAISVFDSRLGRTRESIQAANMALAIEPNNQDIKVELAQALATSENDDDVKKANLMLQDIVKQNPTHQGALITLGFNSFNLGNYPLAIEAWEALVKMRPEGSEGVKMIQKSIEVAKQRMTGEPVTLADHHSKPESQVANNEQESDQDTSAMIKVTVSISEEIKKQLSGTEQLFVFAKAVSGPPLPLAVVKTPINNVNQVFSLSDANAMRPELKLSNFDQVQLVARVSKSGVAIAKAGDFEGKSQPLTAPFSKAPINIAIDSQVK